MIAALTVPFAAVTPLASAAGTVGGALAGQVFRDYDASGARNGAEPGVSGVTVTAVDGDGTVVGSGTTATDGSYTIAAAGAKSTKVRVEFSNLPVGAFPGPKGAGSGTATQFVTLPATASLGVNDPGDYCQQNPEFVTSCFRTGAAGAGIINFPSTAGTTSATSNTGVSTPTTHSLAVPVSAVGSVRGIAYNRSTKSIYSAAFAKTGTGYGPSGPGGIYSTDRATGATTALAVTIAADNAINHSPTSVITDPNAEINTFWNAVGHEAWADIDIAADDTRLFGTNMADAKVYSIALNAAGAATGSAALPAPTLPADAPCAAGNLVPGALKWSGSALWVGFTCTGPAAANLHGYVFKYSAGAGTPSLAASFPLNYTRGCGYTGGCSSGQWNAWTVTNTTLVGNLGTSLVSYPQPWLADIEFTENGQLLIGINDRFGDQSLKAGLRTLTGTAFGDGEGMAVGDVIRLVPQAAGFALDPAYTFGGPSSSSAPDPIGGELFPAAGGFHDEISLGSLAYRLGSGVVASTAMDPAPVNAALPSGATAVNAGGVLWLDSTTGARTQSYNIFDSSDPTTFGKANGLGDLELLCDRAPLEIGNRVWFDANANGQQDAEEAPIGGVTVHLYDGAVLLGTTVTGEDGSWYFNDANVLGGLKPNHSYSVKLDNPADKGTGPLKNYVPTPATVGNPNTDSNAVDMGGSPAVMFTTGSPGANDHTLDIGIRAPAVNAQPAVTLKKYVLRKGGNPTDTNPATNPDWLDAQTPATGAAYNSGDTIPFLIVATNIGNVDLLDAKISSAEVPTCNRTAADVPALARMKPGDVVNITCSASNVTTSGNCSATIVATPASGGPNLTANDPVFFDIPVILVTTTRPTVTVPTGGLPPTGSAPRPWFALSGTFLFLGGLLLLTNRKSRTARTRG